MHKTNVTAFKQQKVIIEKEKSLALARAAFVELNLTARNEPLTFIDSFCLFSICNTGNMVCDSHKRLQLASVCLEIVAVLLCQGQFIPLNYCRVGCIMPKIPGIFDMTRPGVDPVSSSLRCGHSVPATM